ncbi:GH18 family chitinase [Lentzea atacamensis]|uniref:GH18 family chitinase n=1 Tax=Lentzea atacamensis TaxID=531938 RepID=A0A316HNA2_9PSEU|nr:glycosyl hydrolase family 18 protein [Lentzea atacamensis]PWK81474.1 GH18 family chitinase [Lentzea atacamensis]RAS70621.1 GH18 family chitinase [Lentzea atacamensis]
MRSLRSRLGAVSLALAATAATLTVIAPAAQAAYPPGFKSVGYQPSWSSNVSTIPYNKLTHINYAFVLPNANGTLQGVPEPGRLQQLVSLGHQNGVKVSIAVGGWNNGNDDNFEILAANANSRTTFVNALINVVNQYNLDGVDMDWEYPDPGVEGDNFTLLMRQLGDALHSRGKLLTAAVVSEGSVANGVQPAVFGIVDWLNIMAYDGGSPHANYDWSINSVNFWKNRGLPASKAVLGVPFYSRPTYISYRDLVAQDPANANRDCYNGNCYNGLPTIRRKTTWAMSNAGGVMNWELSQDTTNSTSLLNAIWETASGGNPNPPTGGTITGYGGKCVDVAGANSANGTAVQLWTCNGTNAQQWTRNGNTVRALGKCLDASGTANGAVTQIWDCTGAPNQQWTSEANGQLRNVGSGRCLDATGPSSADGTRLQLWDCAGTANQQWRFN